MGNFRHGSDQPLDGLSGVPFEGACMLRMDNLASKSATTPNAHNWVALEGGTISGGKWNGDTAPNLANKFLRANTSAGGTSSACSHQHTIPTSTEIFISACSGSGIRAVTGTSVYSGGNVPPYYDLEIWMRIR